MGAQMATEADSVSNVADRNAKVLVVCLNLPTLLLLMTANDCGEQYRANKAMLAKAEENLKELQAEKNNALLELIEARMYTMQRHVLSLPSFHPLLLPHEPMRQ